MIKVELELDLAVHVDVYNIVIPLNYKFNNIPEFTITKRKLVTEFAGTDRLSQGELEANGSPPPISVRIGRERVL